jgi:hypothetical protein
MQVLVLAVQNAVDYSELGVATSGATLFRSIGGSVGTAVLGSIFSNRLSAELTARLPASARGSLGTGGSVTLDTSRLAKLPAPIHTIFLDAFTSALSTVFEVAAGVAAVAFLLSWLLEQRTLRESVTASTGLGDSFAMPRHSESLAEASRALGVLVGREGRRHLVERLADRAGVALGPAACWVAVRLQEDPQADIPALCREFGLPVEVGERGLQELIDSGMSEPEELAGGHPLTPAGQAAATRLVEERRASLARLCEGWSPERHADLAGLLTRLAGELSREPDQQELTPAPVGAASGAG